MVDSHCHLADDAFSTDLEAVVARARQAGVERALVILAAGNPREAERARVVEELWPEGRFAIGVHPHQALHFADDPQRAATIVGREVAALPSACAVGEVGLDYHYDFSPRELQQTVFRAQVRLARELGRPLVVHTREADEDTLAILGQEGRGEVRGVFHCFTGSSDLAKAALDLGFYISAAGVATFPKASALRATLAEVPIERLLAETDSPFLAPVPHRGKRNEPAWVAQVVAQLAELHGMPAARMAARTASNFAELFEPDARPSRRSPRRSS